MTALLLLLAAPAAPTLGVQLRADPAAHAVRPELGYRQGGAEWVVALDPWFFLDGQHDGELRLQLELPAPGWQLGAGVRASAVRLLGSTYWQERLLVGTFAELPPWLDGLRLQAGAELAWLVAAFSPGTPARLLPTFRGQSAWETVSAGVLLRVMYAAP